MKKPRVVNKTQAEEWIDRLMMKANANGGEVTADDINKAFSRTYGHSPTMRNLSRLHQLARRAIEARKRAAPTSPTVAHACTDTD